MTEDLKTAHSTLKRRVPDSSHEKRVPTLVQLDGPGAVQSFPLENKITRIGRDRQANEIVLSDRFVSRKHAQLVLHDGGGATLEDRESSHGTKVNSERVASADLSDGDLIQIGQAKFKYLDALSAEAPFYSEVFRLAFRDPVTGTYSRRFFDEALSRETLRADRQGYALSVLLIDIDKFKSINDTWGHEVGDQVLARTGAVLQAGLRGESITARFGGDEFTVLLPQSDLAEAMKVAEKLRRAIKGERIGSEGISTTISVGVGTRGKGIKQPAERLLAVADLALYEAKRGGRNRVEGKSLEAGNTGVDVHSTEI